MKKILLLLFFISIYTLVPAQTQRIDNLKEELENHPQQDSIRVNLLIDLASKSRLIRKESKGYANEALTISQNINYLNGQGFAFSLLGGLADLNDNFPEKETMLFLADSIANLTDNSELKANVLWIKAFNEKDMAAKDSLLQQAYHLAVESGALELQVRILIRMTSTGVDESKLRAIYAQADSIAKKTGDFYLQSEVIYWMVVDTKDLQKRKALYSKMISLAEETGDAQYMATITTEIAVILAQSGDHDALSYYIIAEENAEKSGNKKALSSIQISIGKYYMSTLSDYGKAMEYVLEALSSAEAAGDTVNIISAKINLGNLYSYLGDYEKALNYLIKAENANKKVGNKSIEYILQNSLGEIYRLSGKYSEAIEAYNKAIDLSTTLNNLPLNYITISNLADVYLRMDSLDLAFSYAFKSLKAARELKDNSVEGWIDGILSRAYLKDNMPDSAIYYAQLGLAGAKEIGTIEFMRDNTLALANAYAAKEDFANAYSNHLRYLNYRDSMMNEEVRNKTAVQQYTFNLDKKEAQISILHEQKKGQRNLLIGAIALLALIFVVAGLLLRNNRQKQKANALLEKQKQEIDEKAQNVELLSDIGRKITSSLSIENIIGTAYENVNTLMDANVFGIGIYNTETKKIEFPATYEDGEQLSLYSYGADDENRFGSICFTHEKEIVIGDLEVEYKNHISEVPAPYEGGQTLSIIFLPLVSKGEKLGVITLQSFQKNAYSDYHLYMFRNIATYAAIAIENAESYDALNHTLSKLRATQTQLIQSEKMASLGELTAGIAHEIQNPLNFVNNFSEVSAELIEELNEEIVNGDLEEVKTLAGDIKQNLEKINHHGKRADAIVKGMLQHSRTATGVKEPTDINALADEYLRLAYHGLRAKDKSFNADFKTDFDESLEKIDLVPQDIGRVLLNLFNNGFYACAERAKDLPGFENLAGLKPYEPTVSVSTKKVRDHIEIRVGDNGNGIPKEIVDKIFQPFFTTKPTGEGTGLGLSLSYDIIKSHGGELKVETGEGVGTTFILTIPTV